jgi:hypothetical protein
MNFSNILLTGSAALYFVAALPLLFAGDELAARLAGSPTATVAALVQLYGSALFGFAMLNWMNRMARIGGILGRPLLVANLAHAATAFLLLVRPALAHPGELALTLPAALYLLLALAFGSRLFVALPTEPR